MIFVKIFCINTFSFSFSVPFSSFLSLNSDMSIVFASLQFTNFHFNNEVVPFITQFEIFKVHLTNNTFIIEESLLKYPSFTSTGRLTSINASREYGSANTIIESINARVRAIFDSCVTVYTVCEISKFIIDSHFRNKQSKFEVAVIPA